MFKPAQNLQNLPDSEKSELQNLSNVEKVKRSGIGCGSISEPIPEFNKAPCEKVIDGDNNTSIVLGRDRSGPVFKDNGENLGPYGSKGFTECGTIDIVAGRHGGNIRIFEDSGGSKVKIKVDPDFFKDSSRIYISQKTDIDTNFNIGKVENREFEGKSAIGLKSDNIRIVARESIKLVTGTDQKNSMDGQIYKVNGIDLMAGNDEEKLQSIPKGENLVECLKELTNQTSKIIGIMDAFVQHQMDLNESILKHTHISPFYGLKTTPSEQIMIDGRIPMFNILKDVKVSLRNMKINLINFRNSYLEVTGGKYINSKHNRTN